MSIDLSSLIGDPTFAGWVITGVYAVSAALCFVAGTRERRRAAAPDGFPRFWFALGVALLVLSLNKQLDAQAVLTAAARELARAVGWYGHRRLLQDIFVAALAVSFLFITSLVIWSAGRRLLRFPMACCGIALLISFIILRAAWFHHVTWLPPAPSGLVMEFGGATLIAAEAVRVLLRTAAAQRGDDQGWPSWRRANKTP